MNKRALDTALDFIESWLAYRMQNVDIPGMGVAIYQGDGIVFSQAYGVADIEQTLPLTTSNLFAAASQSKMVTSTALLQLVEKGKLRLDDPACMYLSWLNQHQDTRFQEVTIRQLLTHTAGFIRDGLDTDYWLFQEKPFPDTAALRKNVLECKLIFEPNTKVKYSNLGYALLGQIIEIVSGQPYGSYITRHIIRPLKLTATVADFMPSIAAQLATGYGLPYKHQRPAIIHHQATQAFASAVGLHTNPEDMCRFAAAHFLGNQTLLNDVSKKEMQRTQQVVGSGYDSGHQLALGFEPLSINDKRFVGHGGHMGGHLTATYIDPHGQLAVSVMANCKDAPSTQIVRGIIEALDFFEGHAAKPTPKDRERLNIRLHNTTGTVQIIATHDKIVAIDPDDWEPFTWPEEVAYVNPTTLKITTPGSIFNEGELIRYSFAKDKIKTVRYAGVSMLPV